MSGWIDIRVRKPTAADANHIGLVLWLWGDNSCLAYPCGHDFSDFRHQPVAWMPIPRFTPLPDPPDGWRYVQDGEAHDKRAKVWDCDLVQFRERNYPHMPCTPGGVYIVPIAPPAPTYRPFKDAAEFDAFALKPWRYKVDIASTRRLGSIYRDDSHNGNEWSHSLGVKIFSDGTPFGVKVE